ncbi:MAG: hypothetical protein M1825_003983 [Sarcosagium campestre]|nr:MAG: hypothetical protein M1825_003983 [Sarcosagium campestre]
MDGDSSAKTFDKGAGSAIPHLDNSDGVHEASKPRTEPMGEKTQGAGTSAFSGQGAIGSKFQPDGAIGGIAQKVGGPFDKDGAVGKQFKESGAIGGTVQENLGQGEK